MAILSASSGIVVVGEAKDGLEAVEMTALLKPNVVTMDIEMPRLDGYEATRRIMSECPTPIVLVSSLDLRSVGASMEALRVGALDVISKPFGPASPGHAQQARHLAAMVRAMADVRLVRQWARTPSAPFEPTLPSAIKPRVVAIGGLVGR